MVSEVEYAQEIKKAEPSQPLVEPSPLCLLRTSLLAGFLSILLFSACSKDQDLPAEPEPEAPLEVILSHSISVNPSGYAPLSAILSLSTSEDVRIDLKVTGRDGPESEVLQAFADLASSHSIPVHGLYSGENQIELHLYNSAGESLGTQAYNIETPALIPSMPQITIQQAQRDEMEEGMTLVSYFGHSGQPYPQRPFIFDSFGKIRWYLDYSNHPLLSGLFYDNGMERLANGNLYFGDGNSGAIYEIDLFGNVMNSWELEGYGFHHEVHEKPDGNFLVTVNKTGAPTIEDYIIELDRDTGDVLREWDLNQSLDNTRLTFTEDTADWIHVNAITYDPSDDTIVISGRTQGTIKLNNENEVVWILSPHLDWGTSGNGTDLSQYLLSPLDASDNPVTDIEVLEGYENHPDFEWNWYPHAPLITPAGTLMLFDNGDNRNFVGNTYSRAVEYEIDSEAKTIKQLWQYGKERGEETYSRIVSDVDYLAETDHVLFSPGAVNFNGGNYGKSIEVDRSSGELIFEATITPPTSIFGITLHRTERLPLYLPE